MKIPANYTIRLARMPGLDISLGVGGLQLFPASEIEGEQTGYSVKKDGTSLVTDADGGWKASWIVIGCEKSCGDPLILDTSNAALPVLSDFSGQGRWDPVPISPSLEAFLSSFEKFAKLAAGRSTPMERDANPVSDEERGAFLVEIEKINGESMNPDFWGALLEA